MSTTPSATTGSDQPFLRYSAAARLLHWLVALLVLATVPIGITMTMEGLDRAVQDTLFILHKNGGVIILLLLVGRLAWRLAKPPPPLPDSIPSAQRSAARVGHWALYAAVFVMAVSGYVRVRAGGFPVEMLDALGVPTFVPRSDPLAGTAQRVHLIGRNVLILLVLGHVAAVLYHDLVRRDGVFRRMWPPLGRGAP